MNLQTPKEWALYRAKATAQIGRDALEGKIKTPEGVPALEWAVFNLLHAVEEIATAMMHTKETSNKNDFSVSASYDSNGKVFIEDGDGWKRVRADKADQDRIIRCCMCDNPAASLDHFWPYHSEMNRCTEHLGTPGDTQ